MRPFRSEVSEFNIFETINNITKLKQPASLSIRFKMRAGRQSRYQTYSSIIATFIQHQGQQQPASQGMAFGQPVQNNDDVIYAVHYSGTITRVQKGQLQEFNIGMRIICADMLDDDHLILGTISGLIVIDLQESSWWHATSFRGPVLHICCYNNYIYASFADNDEVQSHDGRNRVRGFNIVQIDSQSFKAISEIPKVANSGIFDIDVQRGVLQIPIIHDFAEQPGSFLYNFGISADGNLIKQSPTQIQFEITGVSEFKANAFICFESGILYFIQSTKSIGFECRINCFSAVSDTPGYIFGLQNGQIVYMDENLQGYAITQERQGVAREVTVISQNVELGKSVVIAFGSIQEIDDIRAQSEIYIARFTRYANGALQLNDF